MLQNNVEIPVHHDTVFSHGAYITTEVVPIYEYVGGKRGEQAVDKDTGEGLWAVTVHDADPEAQGPKKSVKVKLIAKHQPVPPPNLPGLPDGMIMRPVEFEGLTIKPYPTEVMEGRYKVAYSITARGMTAPSAPAPRTPAGNGSPSRGQGEPVTT